MSFNDTIRPFFSTTRFKTTLWFSLIFLTFEILLGLFSYIQLYNTLSRNLDIALTKQASAIMTVVRKKNINIEDFIPDANFKAPDELVWDVIFEEVAYDRRNNFIQLQYKDSVIFKSANLYEHRKLDFPNENENYSLFEFNDTSLSSRVIRAVQVKDNRYTVIVAFPKESIAIVLSSLLESYQIMIPLFLIISLIGGAIISQRSLSRIDAIIKKTEDITAQHLDKKIEGEEYNDEYGRLVRKMNQMIGRIKISVDYMNQFSISAAHELKTPLTIMRGETEVVLKSTKTPQQYIEVLKSSYEEILRLIKIVDNLFFISKFDHDMISVKKERIVVDEILTTIINNFNGPAKDRDISLKLETVRGEVILADKELLRQALLNLVDNAIKYSDEDSEIIIRSEKFNNKLKISIINTGDKIPKESLPKIFDRFYRVEGSRNRRTGGVGLGLSVVKAIVDWHDAEIEVESGVNRTTRFSIII